SRGTPSHYSRYCHGILRLRFARSGGQRSNRTHFALEATIASGRYMSRMLPWNSAFNLTVNCERSTRSHRVNCQIVFGEAHPPSFDAVSRGALAELERCGGWCSNPTTKCTASSRTLFVDFFGSK